MTSSHAVSKLAEQSALFRELTSALFEKSVNAMFVSVADGGVVAANPAAYRVFGYEENELLGLDRLAIIEPTDHRLKQLLADREKTGVGESELRMRRKDGAPITAYVSTTLLFERDGVQYASWIVEDISMRLEAERLIKESEERKRFALDAAQIADWELDVEGNQTSASPFLYKLFGHQEPLPWSKETAFAHVHPEDRERVADIYAEAFANAEPFDFECRVTWPDQSLHWIWAKGRFYKDSKGKTVRAAGIAMEVTKSKLVQQTLLLGTRALEAAKNGIVIVDALAPDMPIIFVNTGFEKITGYSADEALGKNCRFLQNGDDAQDGLEEIRLALRDKKEVSAEIRNYRKDGTLFWNELSISPVTDANGAVTHYVGVQNDVTERKRHAEELAYQATHDLLTGLPNRLLFNDSLEQAISRARRHHSKLAVLYLDLDNFKLLNDTLGHATGDMIIKQFGERLHACKRAEDLVSRLSGDEFAMICPGIESRANAHALVQRLMECMREPLAIGRQNIQATVSIGVALFPKDANDAGELLKRADIAMYASKKVGRNHFRFFAPSMAEPLGHRLSFEQDLRHAAARGEIHLAYQPQTDFATGKLVGIEAMVRWNHPQFGEILPSRFIPIAEETGIIVQLGEWILRHACAQNKQWIDEGMPPVPMAVNVSAVQFRQPHFLGMVNQVLRDTGLPPEYLEIEVTESVVMHGVEVAVDKLRALKHKGLQLSIDDFGTGYSSLSYLSQFPLDQLKIDQSFVRDLPADRNAIAITGAIISMGRGLGLRVLAEGVENPQQAEFLREMGCDNAQGYLYSKPLSAEQLREWCRAH